MMKSFEFQESQQAVLDTRTQTACVVITLLEGFIAQLPYMWRQGENDTG